MCRYARGNVRIYAHRHARGGVQEAADERYVRGPGERREVTRDLEQTGASNIVGNKNVKIESFIFLTKILINKTAMNTCC